MKKRVIFVTGNANKLAEVQAILTEEYSVESINLDVPELQGERDEIARAKCEFAVAAVTSANDRKEKENIFVVTEDTSLCFNALNELPGPYIKHFLQRIGLEGLNKLLEGFSDKSAYAICTLAVSNGSEVKIIEGKILGRIVAPRGPKNFGWDPIFQPEGYDETFAEMSKEVKNNISHRSKAFNALKEWFKLT